jgi:alcohol dehydrogenase (cytochrome c)
MLNPFDIGGKFSRPDKDAGWIHAVDADTGVWKWRLKSDYPIVAAVTPTAGGLVFFGDVGGDLYAVDAETGEKLWSQRMVGPLGGGVITYSVNGSQKVAVATGLVSPAWPVPVRTGKIAILGLEGGAGQ